MHRGGGEGVRVQLLPLRAPGGGRRAAIGSVNVYQEGFNRGLILCATPLRR